jgi:hypothetical protein
MMQCARCRAYVQDGPFAWGPKCAKASGFTKPTDADPRQIALSLEPPKITQGHVYDFYGATVMVMEEGEKPLVATIADPWLKDHRRVYAEDLRPLAMKYFGGEVPA